MTRQFFKKYLTKQNSIELIEEVGGNGGGGSSGRFRGQWNASTNTPTLPSTPTEPDYLEGDNWQVSVAGTQFGFDFTIGDELIVITDGAGGLEWDKKEGGIVDKVNNIAPVNGNVSLTQDNIPDGTTNKQFSNTEKTKLAGIEANADVTDAINIASSINGVTTKNTPVDADTIPLIDSQVTNSLKKLSWLNLKATLKSYFDNIYQIALGFTPEDVDNKATDFDISNDELYPSVKATKTYVDSGLSGKVNKSGDSMSGDLTFGTGANININSITEDGILKIKLNGATSNRIVERFDPENENTITTISDNDLFLGFDALSSFEAIQLSALKIKNYITGGSHNTAISAYDAIVTTLTTGTNIYADLKSAIVASKKNILVISDNSNTDITLNQSIDVTIAKGVTLTLGVSTNNTPLITDSNSINFYGDGNVLFAPAGASKGMQVNNANSSTQSSSCRFFGVNIAMGTAANNSNLADKIPLNIDNCNITSANAVNAGLDLMNGSTISNSKIIINGSSTVQALLIRFGAVANNIIIDFANYNCGTVLDVYGFCNGIHSIGGGAGGGSGIYRVGYTLMNATTASSNAPSIDYSILANNAILFNVDFDGGDLDLDDHGNCKIVLFKDINDIAFGNPGSKNHFAYGNLVGASTALGGDSLVLNDVTFSNTLKLGATGLYELSNSTFNSVILNNGGTFTRENVSGNLTLNGCSANINNTVSITNDYTIKGNEFVIADASGGNITITAPASIAIDQKINIKALNNSTNSVIFDAGSGNVVESSGAQTYTLNERESVNYQYISSSSTYINI